MAKKSFESSQREKLRRVSRNSTMTESELAELQALEAMSDADIDTSDIPEKLDWSNAQVGRFYRPVKQPVTIRLDSDLVSWLKETRPQYQTAVNGFLRTLMELAIRNPGPREKMGQLDKDVELVMRAKNRLGSLEIAKLRDRFCQWQKPEDMLLAERAVADDVGSAVYLTQAGLGFLRDAYVASRFARFFANMESVRLVPSDAPDFEWKTRDEAVGKAEVTEADIPGRRRGQEYKNLPHPTPVEFEDVDLDELERICIRFGPASLRDACQSKADRFYSKDTDLVVYFNFESYFPEDRKRHARSFFLQSTEVAKDKFANVYVLWGGELYHMWKSGQPRMTVRSPFKDSQMDQSGKLVSTVTK